MPNWFNRQTISSNLKFIIDKWISKGINLLIFEYNDRILIDTIIVPKNMRNKGIGSMVMNDIISYANSVGKRIVLTPAQKGDLGGEVSSKKRLLDFYKKFNFKENKGKNKDYSLSEGMYREPNELV